MRWNPIRSSIHAAVGLSTVLFATAFAAASDSFVDFLLNQEGASTFTVSMDTVIQTEFLENEFNPGGVDGAGTDIDVGVIDDTGTATGEIKQVEPLEVGDAIEGYILFPTIDLPSGAGQTVTEFQLTGEYLYEVTSIDNGVAQLSGFFNIYEDRVASSSNPGGFSLAEFPDETNFLDGDLLIQFDVQGQLDAGPLADDGQIPGSVRGVIAENIDTGATLSLTGSYDPGATDEDGNLSLVALAGSVAAVGDVQIDDALSAPLESKIEVSPFDIFGYGGVGVFAFEVTTIPEPSTTILAALGLAGLVGLRRRRVA